MAGLPAFIPRYTRADLERWEDRWELIDGIPHAMSPAPAIRHQLISQRLTGLLEDAVAECEACVVLTAGNWRIAEDTIVIPDLMVLCPTDRLEGVYVEEAPLLIAEILSPSTAAKDRTLKSALYAEQGVTHYLIVDPEEDLVEAYHLNDTRYRKHFEGHDGSLALDLGPCRATLDLSRTWPR